MLPRKIKMVSATIIFSIFLDKKYTRTKLVYVAYYKGAWLSERLRRCSNKPDVVGSIPVTTEFLVKCHHELKRTETREL